MTPPAHPERYKNHRFPGEIISHGVWLYYCFPLSYRDVQELLLERGIDVTYEAIRQWCLKFGQHYARRLGAQHGVTTRGPRSPSGGLGRRGGGAGGEKGLYFSYPFSSAQAGHSLSCVAARPSLFASHAVLA